MRDHLSLFDIERGLHELLDAWQEAETPEAVAAAERAIQAYAEAEVRKVDGIRRYLRACSDQAAAAKSEAQVQATRAKAWEARGARLKQFCFDVMKSFGVTKLEGQTGSLRIQPNGGKQSVIVSDEGMVPAEFCTVEIRIPLTQWYAILKRAGIDAVEVRTGASITRTPSLSLIAAELEKPCEACKGTKTVPRPIWCSGGHVAVFPHGCNLCERFLAQGTKETDPCSACGGSGKRGVPGASLAPRGENVRVS